MRIALLAPLPPEQNGIADYAGHLRQALEGL
ncbi:glycosyl transferase, group 1 family protein PslF, partial [Pseudomonas syringae pv. actinidiae ICMP 18807]